MSKYRVTKRYEFDAAHRLCDYDGPCGRVHGHRYALEVTLEGKKLDEMGILFDFSQINSLIKPLLEEWDHHLLLWRDDPLCKNKEMSAVVLSSRPTAEVMACLAWEIVVRSMDAQRIENVWIVNIRVYETPNCWVDYSDAC